MSLFLVTAPTDEPVSLGDLKDHLRVFHDDENDLIADHGVAARLWTEAYLQRPLMPQTWDQKSDMFPCGSSLWLEKSPLLTSTAPVVTYVDTAGVTQTWSASLYTVDAPTGPWPPKGRLFLNYGQQFPATRGIENAVVVRYLAGYANVAAVPSAIKAAIKIMVGHWYTHREPVVTGTIVASVPMAAESLLWPFKSF